MVISDMNNMNSEEQLFSFYMHEVAAAPQDFLTKVKGKAEPEYWETFWAYYAAIRLGDEKFKEQIYEEYIEDQDIGNDFHLLLAYEKYLEYLNDPDYPEYLMFGLDFLAWAEEGLSPLLNEAFEVLRGLLSPEEEEATAEADFYKKQLFIA